MLYFLINFYWTIVALQHCVNFCCTAEWISHISPPFWTSSSSGHHSASSRVPCALQHVLVSYLFYTHMSIPISQFLLLPLSPWKLITCSLVWGAQ